MGPLPLTRSAVPTSRTRFQGRRPDGPDYRTRTLRHVYAAGTDFELHRPEAQNTKPCKRAAALWPVGPLVRDSNVTR